MKVDVKVDVKTQSLSDNDPHAFAVSRRHLTCNSCRTPEAKSPPVTPRPASAGAKAPPAKVERCGHVWTCCQCSECSVVGKGSMHYDELRILRTLRSHNCFTRVSEQFHREPTHRRRVLLQSSCSVPLYLGI